jgi:hypothetical protein
MRNKNCVYTIITNNYCDLNEIIIKSDGWDYYCFTDNKNLKSKTWKIIYINNPNNGIIEKIKLTRKYKTQGFKEIDGYENYLYVDGRIKILKDLNLYLNRLGNYDILFNKHRGDSILGHMVLIKNLGYEKEEIINKIKKDMKNMGIIMIMD